jgi:predicted amidohydrolase
MKIALAQSDIVWNDPEANHAVARTFVERAADAGVRLLLFPEMFNTGFSFPVGRLAETAYQQGTAFLQEMASRHGLFIAGSLPDIQEDANHPFNTLFIYGPNGCLGTYSKIHLIGTLGEKDSYQLGASRLIVEIEGVRICFAICYDLRFPYLFYDVAQQADLFAIVANWPSMRHEHWLTLLQARAIENQAYVAGVNRVGHGGGFEFLGGSRILSPHGKILAEGDSHPDLLIADIFPAEVAAYRTELPFLRDRQELRR